MLAPPELQEIHPLGKSPVLSIAVPGREKPLVLAESGLIAEYLAEHFAGGIDGEEGKSGLVPKRWQEGQEGKLGGETEEWLRYKYYLHYAEGSLMPVLLISLILGRLKSPSIPFLLRPITSVVANKIISLFVFPNAKRHMSFLQEQLSTSSGPYLIGRHLTAADILMSFPLLAARERFPGLGSWEGGDMRRGHEKVYEYLERMEGMESFKRAVKRVEESEGVGKGATIEKVKE
ncbi:Glutathione S-transferase 1 [Zalerion maritima]|uniref:Glutathione S-transferase 1 n=1 Tax=Zalerion maritima TaxID=339359 RepID=A0AAD5WQB0_9PEZI|nr:Glutathione S-transferase 1 [Zalerion maritima]